jgi:hypothetical protein
MKLIRAFTFMHTFDNLEKGFNITIKIIDRVPNVYLYDKEAAEDIIELDNKYNEWNYVINNKIYCNNDFIINKAPISGIKKKDNSFNKGDNVLVRLINHIGKNINNLICRHGSYSGIEHDELTIGEIICSDNTNSDYYLVEVHNTKANNKQGNIRLIYHKKDIKNKPITSNIKDKERESFQDAVKRNNHVIILNNEQDISFLPTKENKHKQTNKYNGKIIKVQRKSSKVRRGKRSEGETVENRRPSKTIRGRYLGNIQRMGS